MNQFNVAIPSAYAVSIARSDRWQAYQHLQNLGIACHCAADGTLWVAVPDVVTAVLLRSVVQQLTCSRQELADWLHRCWQAKMNQGDQCK